MGSGQGGEICLLESRLGKTTLMRRRLISKSRAIWKRVREVRLVKVGVVIWRVSSLVRKRIAWERSGETNLAKMRDSETGKVRENLR